MTGNTLQQQQQPSSSAAAAAGGGGGCVDEDQRMQLQVAAARGGGALQPTMATTNPSLMATNLLHEIDTAVQVKGGVRVRG
jgi:hypothetical protein